MRVCNIVVIWCKAGFECGCVISGKASSFEKGQVSIGGRFRGFSK